MKIPERTLRKLQDLIVPLDTRERRERYVAGDFFNADRVKDLNKRYRWDLYFEAIPSADDDLAAEMNQYLDTHLDTALRRLIAPLGVKS